MVANILVFFLKMLIHHPRHLIDRKSLNLTITAYRSHQNDLAYRKH